MVYIWLWYIYMVIDFQESLIFRSIFIENQIEFLNKSKYVWRYSCVECVEAVMMTVGAGITANEASPGPSYGAFHRKFSKSMAENAISRKPSIQVFLYKCLYYTYILYVISVSKKQQKIRRIIKIQVPQAGGLGVKC